MARYRGRPCHTSSVLSLSVAYLAICLDSVATAASLVYSDLYPLNDEYDFTILDPDNVFGSPYGGFSRATTSRLAALPLKLPNIGEELEEFDEIYMEIRDVEGARYVCRTFHEDELEPESLSDSMFNMPKLKTTQEEKDAIKMTTMQQQTADTSDPSDSSTIPASEKATDNEDESGDSKSTSNDESSGGKRKATAFLSSIGESPTSSSSETTAIKGSSLDKDMPNANDILAEVDRRLDQLQGMCAQLHKGWWSYEWCHQEIITQFHVHVEGHSNKVSDVQLQDLTKLGIFSERKVHIVDEAFFQQNQDEDDALNAADTATTATSSSSKNSRSRKPKTRKKPSNWIAGDQKELARVSDLFVDGDVCPETGKPRITQVDFQCCSERVFDRHRGGVLHHGVPKTTSLLALLSFSEMENQVCIYNATLCTPLLCDGEEGSTEPNTKNLKDSSSKRPDLPNTINPNKPIEELSVREILDLTFLRQQNACIQSGTGGWWVYELCHGKHVRQFHETTLLDRISGAATIAVETEHILGAYDSKVHESYPKENEWKHVVNATNLNVDTNDRNSLSSTIGGNGAYFFQEYTRGDLCDHADVTDSAIKAGEVRGGGIERAATVRYSCGYTFDMTVKEDSTCHYIVDVSIPTLCDHPLFRAPVSKKAVIKCLPAATVN